MTTHTFPQEVSRRAGWSIFTGILTALVGALMIVYPLSAGALSTVFFGAALIVAAVAQLIFAFSSDTAGSFFGRLLLGVLYGIAGVALLAFPGIGLVTLTGMLGGMLIAEAVVETVIGFGLPSGGGRGSFLISALFSLTLGVMIFAQWPASSIWAIGTLVGAAVLVNGITRVVISATLRHGAKAIGRATLAA
jgi:uncharacterized membrane protein HdeD (DUF308 family)